MQKINLKNKFESFNEYWSPKILGDLNDSHVKIAKFKGDFVWHKHLMKMNYFNYKRNVGNSI